MKSFNDTDHIAPIIFRFLEKDEKVKIIYLSNFDFKNDYRIKFLSKFKNLSVIKASFFMKTKNMIFNNRYILQLRLKLSPKIKKIISKFLSPELNNVKCVIYEWCEPNRRAIGFQNAKDLLIPVICIPHGLNIFINYDFNNHIKSRIINTGEWPDHSNRNKFDAYIFQSKRHLKMAWDWGHDRKKTYFLGSPRFDPKWAKINLNLIKKSNPKISNLKKKTKIVFFLPHWSYNVDKTKTLSCIKKLTLDKTNLIVIKGHTRGTGSLSKKEYKNFKKYNNLILDSSIHSPELIRLSDIIINFGSSIGIEALIQKKIYINPSFLHQNRTIFDNTKLVHIPKNIKEFINLINLSKINKLKKNNITEFNKFMKKEVYAEKDRLDVLENYYLKINHFTNSHVS